MHSRTADNTSTAAPLALKTACKLDAPTLTVAEGSIKTTEVSVSWSKLAQPWIRSHIPDYIPTEKGLETECENLNFSYQPRGEKATCS